MQTSERQSFGQLLITVGELYNKHVSPTLIKLYWRILERYDWQDVVVAFQYHVADPDYGQFMPKPADIIRAIKGNSQSQSLQAWSKVEEAIRLVGPYRSVVFDDPAIHGVLQEMGGWVKLCQTLEKNLAFIAKEFQTRIRAYLHKPPTDYPSYFLGISEHQNFLNGLSIEPKVLIGDKQKALAVLNSSNETKQLFHQKCINQESKDARTTTIVNQA